MRSSGVQLAEPRKVFGAETAMVAGAGEEAAQAQPPARPPLLCPGCPHRGAFYAVKSALKKPSDGIFCGDIGCYTLGNAKPLNAVDTCLCMGAGITVAQGFSVVEPGKKALSFVGDSTFFASGMTGIANAVYNQHDITVCVLDNATTAMTRIAAPSWHGRYLDGAQVRADFHRSGAARIGREGYHACQPSALG